MAASTTGLTPICMAASSAGHTNLSVNKASLNSFNYKGRSGKLPSSCLLGISPAVTRVETLGLSGETL